MTGARHLEAVEVGRLGAAALDDLLSRTDLGELADVLAHVRADPYGPLAERLRHVAETRDDGVGVVVTRLLGRWRAARPVASGTLRELRRHRGRTQADLARALATGQSDVSKLERRPDLQLSTLHRYVEALGGRLEVRVRWPDGDLSNLGHPALDR